MKHWVGEVSNNEFHFFSNLKQGLYNAVHFYRFISENFAKMTINNNFHILKHWTQHKL